MATDRSITLTPRERLHLMCASDLQHAASHGDMAWVDDAIFGMQVAKLTCPEQTALHQKLNPADGQGDLDELLPIEIRTKAREDRARMN